MNETLICDLPEHTFAVGRSVGKGLRPGDAILLRGGLGAGKTLFTKGIMAALGFDIDEVTSPSFALVNLYRAERLEVFHIDLWRIEEGTDAAFGVGLDEIAERPNAVIVIEWAERLGPYSFPGRVIDVEIEGEGDERRQITIDETGRVPVAAG